MPAHVGGASLRTSVPVSLLRSLLDALGERTTIVVLRALAALACLGAVAASLVLVHRLPIAFDCLLGYAVAAGWTFWLERSEAL